MNIILVLTIGLLSAMTTAEVYPVCRIGAKDMSIYPPTNFVLFVDRALETEVLKRIAYLMKSITCEIPIGPKFQLTIGHYAGKQKSFCAPGNSTEVARVLTNDRIEKPGSTRCGSFRGSLSQIPKVILDSANVHFIVPLFAETGCLYQKEFRDHFRNHTNKRNFYFNGILINQTPTLENQRSVRMAIPDLQNAINPEAQEIDDLSTAVDHVHVPKNDMLSHTYKDMVYDILNGNIDHDWDYNDTITTTTVPSTTFESTTVSSTTSSTPTPEPTTEEDLDELISFGGNVDDGEAKVFGVDDNSTTESLNSTTLASTTIFESSTSSERQNSTTSESSTTTEKVQKRAGRLTNSSSTTATFESTTFESTTVSSNTSTHNFTDIDYDPDIEEDSDEAMLAMMSGDKKNIEGEDGTLWTTTTVETWFMISAHKMFYLLLLLLLIWLICLILCLVWMFICARRKKTKLGNEAEQQQIQPLLESGNQKKPKKLEPLQSTASDEDDAWKSIKPSAEPAPKSETESVHQPPVVYDPVEVSEFEDRNDDDLEEQPRHGYVPARKAADLQFD